MEKNSYIFNSKRWPKGFLIALAMIVIIEIMVVKFDDHFYFPPFNNLRMRVKNDISLSNQHVYNVLILGDSYNLTGLDPKIISAETGLSVFNFSTFAVNSIISSYVLFKNQLKYSAGQSRVLVLGYLDYIPQMDQATVYEKYGHTFFDFKRGNLNVFVKEFGLGIGLKQLIPSLKHQGYFLLMAKPTPIDKIRSIEESVYESKGFYEWHADRNFDGGFGYENDDQSFEVSPFFKKYIHKILALARKNKMKVLYVIPSVVPDLHKRLSNAGRRDAYLEYLGRLQDEYENLQVLFPQEQLSAPALYTDQDHLNQKGGKMLSLLVSDWIRANTGMGVR